MSGGRIPKKCDFYMGGRGIDHFGEDDSMECQAFSPNPIEEDSLPQNSPMGSPSPPDMYVVEDRSYISPTFTQPHLYPQNISPTQQYPPQFMPDHNSRSPKLSHNLQNNLSIYVTQPGGHQPGLVPSSSSHLRHMYPQMAQLTGPMLPVHPIYPDAPYATCLPPEHFPPLRQAPHTNGMDSSSMGLYEAPTHASARQDGPSGGSSWSEGQKKRKQECSLCLNHNQHNEVKGHKWFCPRRKCECSRCEITRGRQHHMKEQQKLTRALNRNNNP